MKNCHEITRLVSQGQERRLSLGERLQLRLHLLMCRGCANFEKNTRKLHRLMQAFARGQNEKTPGDDLK